MPARRPLYSILLFFFILTGCATFGISEFEEKYGPAAPKDRTVAKLSDDQIDYWSAVKPILDNRCVVCHGCYDASCQMKLTSIEGVMRGASNQKIYHKSRLRSSTPSRLYEDAQTLDEWRQRGFHSVLNERESTPEANREASTMYQLLALKERHPLPTDPILSEDFTLNLGREESCPADSEMAAHSKQNPLWGMPYALPGIEDSKQSILKKWIEQGATYTPRAALDKRYSHSIADWESLLNNDDLKAQLSSRYIYEHLFLGHLYFDDISDRQFFKIVRSSTPPGEPVQIIATRRPFSNPNVDRVYYRIVPELETIVAKSHLPYALNPKRMERWKSLFYDADFEVKKLPGYRPKLAANPFATFAQLPMQSRYKFMLDEAHFTIGSYIKGSVCRGQVALNVIRDHFWVFFVDPDVAQNTALSEAVEFNLDAFDLPAASGDIYLPITAWFKYAIKQREAIRGRIKFMRKQFGDDNRPTLDIVWDGDKNNQNAALTIYRHFNSASVEKGLLGNPPQTAWLISYPLLERIHYLLVAGYDVYGNYGHQLTTRLYMDFLRLDGEMSFLGLLPSETRAKEWKNWYRDNNKERVHMMTMLTDEMLESDMEPNVNYKTANPKLELFDLLGKRLGSANSKRRSLDQISDRSLVSQLKKLSTFSGLGTQHLPEVTFIRFQDKDKKYFTDITLMRNNAHLNITSVFREAKTLAPAENTVSVLAGMVGTYPNAFFTVNYADRQAFIDRLMSLSSESSYAQLKTDFGIRRTDKRFWAYSDRLHLALKAENTTEYGLLDFSRLENR